MGSASAVPLLNLMTTPLVPPTQKLLCLPRDSLTPQGSAGAASSSHEDILVLILSEKQLSTSMQGPTGRAGGPGACGLPRATQAAGSSEPERLSGLLLGSCCWPLGSSPTQHVLRAAATTVRADDGAGIIQLLRYLISWKHSAP